MPSNIPNDKSDAGQQPASPPPAKQDIDELFLVAADSPGESETAQLLEHAPSASKEALSDGVEILLDSWEGSISGDKTKSQTILALAALPAAPDTPTFRNAIQKAFSTLRTTSIPSSALLKATGIRSGKPIQEAVARFHTLNRLAPGAIAFNPTTGRRGTVGEIDGLSFEMGIRWEGVPTEMLIPLDAALDDLAFIENAPPADSPPPVGKAPVEEYIRGLESLFISPFDKTTAERFALSVAATSGTGKDAFLDWWHSRDNTVTSKSPLRNFWNARSLREFRETSAAHLKSGLPTPAQWSAELAKSLDSMKIGTSKADLTLLADALADTAEIAGVAELAPVLAKLKDKIPLWPSKPESLSSGAAAAWFALPVASIAKLAELTAAVVSKQYLAELVSRLPFRCLNATADVAGIDNLASALDTTNPSADILLWIWKNRKHLPKNITGTLSARNLIKSIDSAPSGPLAAAAKELKKLLLTSRELRKTILAKPDAAAAAVDSIHASSAIQTDEKQSLLVKMAADSPEIKKILETGKGRKIFASAAESSEKMAADLDKNITSIRSHAAKAAELKDLVSKLIPENSAAIAHARSYGDLRENAEYKAAKERQAFLASRRAELEQGISILTPVDFRTVEVADTAIPGSTVTLEFENGDTETYHLLGAWDGNPETHEIPHVSALGAVLNGKKIGDTITMPDKRSAKIKDVAPLPKELAERLATV